MHQFNRSICGVFSCQRTTTCTRCEDCRTCYQTIAL